MVAEPGARRAGEPIHTWRLTVCAGAEIVPLFRHPMRAAPADAAPARCMEIV